MHKPKLFSHFKFYCCLCMVTNILL